MSSITSMSKEGSSSNTGLTGSSSSPSDWSSCRVPSLASSTWSSPILSVTPSLCSSSSSSLIGCCLETTSLAAEPCDAVGSGVSGSSSSLSEGSASDWCLSLVGSVVLATGSNWLCDWLSSSTDVTRQDSVLSSGPASTPFLISACR